MITTYYSSTPRMELCTVFRRALPSSHRGKLLPMRHQPSPAPPLSPCQVRRIQQHYLPQPSPRSQTVLSPGDETMSLLHNFLASYPRCLHVSLARSGQCYNCTTTPLPPPPAVITRIYQYTSVYIVSSPLTSSLFSYSWFQDLFKTFTPASSCISSRRVVYAH